VAQLQALFLKFHNKVYDLLGPRFPAGKEDERFLAAQRIVRWSYQWIVLHDFLPKVCGTQIVSKVMPKKGDREPNLDFYTAHGAAYIPIEFAVAAYRFGHSMVRPSYSLNDVVRKGTGTFPFNGAQVPFARIPVFVGHATASTDAMNGFGELAPQLPPSWGIDWTFFFGTPGTAAAGAPQIPQPSYRIDATLVDPLGDLPEFAAAGVPSPFASLAFRNLLRGFRMHLPSGQRVAQMMGVEPLSDEQLWSKKNEGETLEDWPEGTTFLNANRKWLEGAAPLWYYILKEAEVKHHGRHLGAVGGRIVAETLVGLAWYDHFSYLFQMPLWTPALEGIGLGATLDMLELTTFVG
ncbi:MAG TPA: peroxidase family protein, partial [Burkholderiales bacterium]|nr:peroxidase family protein [Burkholderiales bacterium]